MTNSREGRSHQLHSRSAADLRPSASVATRRFELPWDHDAGTSINAQDREKLKEVLS
jgi:hypothetical protein